jgi:hypothetical protein
VIPLAIWLVLIGYTVTWTGKMNLGVSYAPQADGTIQPVGADGKPARTYTLMDAITCGQPSGTPQGAPGAPAPAPPPDQTPLPTLPNLHGILGLLPRPQPITVPRPGGIPLPGGVIIPGGETEPAPRPKPGLGILDSLAQFVHNLLNPGVNRLAGLGLHL